MPTEREQLIITKAAVFDLIEIFESNSEKDSYTVEEIKTILKAYLKEVAK
mgnify:CR=1 FL=1